MLAAGCLFAQGRQCDTDDLPDHLLFERRAVRKQFGDIFVEIDRFYRQTVTEKLVDTDAEYVTEPQQRIQRRSVRSIFKVGNGTGGGIDFLSQLFLSHMIFDTKFFQTFSESGGVK